MRLVVYRDYTLYWYTCTALFLIQLYFALSYFASTYVYIPFILAAAAH